MKLSLVGRGPYFSGLRGALARAIRSLGHEVLEREGMPPLAEGNALIVIGPQDHGPPPKGHSTFVSCALLTEQPGYWGDPLKHPATEFYSVFCDVFRDRPAFEKPRHFVPVWTEWEQTSADEGMVKELDVLWFGARTPRRQEILKAIDAKVPVHEPAGFLEGEKKRLALRAAKVVPLIRASDFGLFEPFRMLDAASCGVLVVTEPPRSDTAPWVAGENFFVADSPEMPRTVAEIVEKYHDLGNRIAATHEKSRQFTALASAKEILTACLAA